MTPEDNYQTDGQLTRLVKRVDPDLLYIFN